MPHALVSWTIKQLVNCGWVDEDDCASRICPDPRFSIVVEPIIAATPRGTFFRCEVGVRSFRHQFLANWATTEAKAICSLAHRLRARWYPYFFAGGDFRSALKRNVSFIYRVSGNAASKEAALKEGLGEILGSIGSLEVFADDKLIGVLSARDYLGPYEVGAGVCSALIGDRRGVQRAMEARPSGWFSPDDIAKIQTRLLTVIDEGRCSEIASWREPREAWHHDGKV